MANVKLKKKKGEGGYEQLYPQTLGKNVITSTGDAQTDIIILRQRITGLEFQKGIQLMEASERYSNGTYHYYEVTGEDQFQYPDRNLKIVFNETNTGSHIVIQTIDYMGITNNYEIFAGFYGREFEDGEIKSGKIYSLIYHNYQFYLAE